MRCALRRRVAAVRASPLGAPALFWVEGWERKAGEWDKCASTPGGVCSALVPRNQIPDPTNTIRAQTRQSKLIAISASWDIVLISYMQHTYMSIQLYSRL